MYRNLYHSFCLVGLLWFIVGCGPKEVEYSVEYPIHIQLSKFMETELEISNISSIADSIWYILLETHPDALIGYADFHEIPGGFIARTQYELLFFTREGRYLHKISARGRGPGEYMSIHPSFGIDTTLQKVYIPDWYHSVLVYGFDGLYQKSIRLNYVNQMAGILPDGSCFVGPMMLDNPYQIYSPSGELLTEDTVIVNPGESRISTGPGGIYFYRLWIASGDHGLWVTEPDTTWLFHGYDTKIPFLVINPFLVDNKPEALFCVPAPMTDDYFGISSSFYGLYSIGHDKYFRIKGLDGFRLFDDMDNGPPITLRRASSGKMITSLSAIELLEPDNPVFHPTDKLQKVIGQLHINDNPVLRIIRLKPFIDFH